MKDIKNNAREWTLWFNPKDETGGINTKGKYISDPWIEYVDVIESKAFEQLKAENKFLEEQLEFERHNSEKYMNDLFKLSEENQRLREKIK